MPIAIHELRLSLVWNKVFFKDTNLPFLADPGQYSAAFDNARKAEATGGPWCLPWLEGHHQHFWQYYLQPVEPSNFEAISTANARAYFVPLRLPACAQAIARDGTVATLEGFCFPHSVGIVATIHVRPAKSLPLLEMVKAAVAARNADFQLIWKDKAPATHGNLQSLADKMVERVHALALKDKTAVGKPLPFPITIATAIDADIELNSQASGPTPVTAPEVVAQPGAATNSASAPAAAPDADDRSLGRALNAWCELKSGWRNKKFDPGLPDYIDPETDQFLAIDRGRAIWLPRHFSANETKGRKTALGCYHRNLTLASMQTAALTALLGRADEILADPKGQLLFLQVKEVAQAIDLLGKLKAGDYSTYRSWSLQYQIAFNDERIERVSKKLGL